MNLSFDEIKLNNPGVLKTRLPSAIFDSLKVDVQEAIDKRDPYNEHLVGNIEEEYTFIVKDYFKMVLDEMYREYQERFNFCKGREYGIPERAWVNLQKKHEFNPLHHHNGIVSWVCWINIPYFLQDEMNVKSAVNSVSPSSSLFEFAYTSILGNLQSHQLPIDKFWEGNMIMFPAELRHMVYPFYTSDEYRISIAGNINLLEDPRVGR